MRSQETVAWWLGVTCRALLWAFCLLGLFVAVNFAPKLGDFRYVGF